MREERRRGQKICGGKSRVMEKIVEKVKRRFERK
jgi:hypothetical protein